MNSVCLTGRLAADPEVIGSPGRTGAAMRLRFNDSRGRVNFVTVVAWGANARACLDRCRSERLMAVTGELRLDEWTGRDGQRRQEHRIFARQVDWLRRAAGETE